NCGQVVIAAIGKSDQRSDRRRGQRSRLLIRNRNRFLWVRELTPSTVICVFNIAMKSRGRDCNTRPPRLPGQVGTPFLERLLTRTSRIPLCSWLLKTEKWSAWNSHPPFRPV